MVHFNCVSGSSTVLRNRPKMYPWKWRSQAIENRMTNPRSLQEAPPEAPGSPYNDWTVRGPDVHPAKREESTSGLQRSVSAVRQDGCVTPGPSHDTSRKANCKTLHNYTLQSNPP